MKYGEKLEKGHVKDNHQHHKTIAEKASRDPLYREYQHKFKPNDPRRPTWIEFSRRARKG